MKKMQLPREQALVLKHINDLGEEDFSGLAESLRIGRAKLAQIIQVLYHKRLILVRRASYAEMWVRLSTKGRHFMHSIVAERPSYQF